MLGGINVLDENKDNLREWTSFKVAHDGKLEWKEIFECIEELEKEPALTLIEKALTLIRNYEIFLKEKPFLVLMHKLKAEAARVNTEALGWWDVFVLEYGVTPQFLNVVVALEDAEKKESKESLERAILLISELDLLNCEDELNTLNKKIRILQKRLSRRVSHNLGSIILSLREQKGLSLSKLGEMAGVSASYINRLELNERRAPSYPIIEKLAEALDVNINTLLVAAGASPDTSETKSLRELVFSYSLSLTEKGEPLSVKKKEELIRIIDFISEMKWQDNKHIESLQLFELINLYKKTKS